jgi:hypothetical protein
MFFLIEMTLDATKKTLTDSHQRPSYTLPRTSNTVSDLLNAHLIHVAQLQKVAIFRTKFLHAVTELFDIGVKGVATNSRL